MVALAALDRMSCGHGTVARFGDPECRCLAMYIFQMAWLVGDIVMMSAGLILLWYIVVVARRAAWGRGH
jgi:hypothetical protein